MTAYCAGGKPIRSGDALGRCFDCMWNGKSQCPGGVAPSDRPSAAEARQAVEWLMQAAGVDTSESAAVLYRFIAASGVAPSQAPGLACSFHGVQASPPTLLSYEEIECIVDEVLTKYPDRNQRQIAHYAADRAQRAVLQRNAGVKEGDRG